MNGENLLQQTLQRLNDNKSLFMLGMQDFEDLATRPAPNILKPAQQKLANRTAPDALMVRMRRSKDAIPVKKTADGKVLYSDASTTRVEVPQNDTGRQEGFANLQLPTYSTEKDTNVQAEVPQAPTDRLADTLVNPAPPRETENRTQDIKTPKDAFEAFMMEADAVEGEFKNELAQAIASPESQVQQTAEGRAIDLQYNPSQGIQLAPNATTRYNQSQIPTNVFIGGIKNPSTTRYEDLIGDSQISQTFI